MATDYGKQTVVQLKKLASERGISAALKSGLRKADIIEKMEQFDAEMSTQEASAPEPAPGADQDAIMDDVSGVEGELEPSNEPVVPPHHKPTQPIEQESLPAPTVETASLPETRAQIGPTPDPEEPLPSVVTNTEAEIYTTEVAELVVNAPPDLDTPVPAEEIIDDRRKRKRRSVTPPVQEAEIAAKRRRQEENPDTDAAVADAPPQVTESIEFEEQAGDDKAVGESEQEKEEASVSDSVKAQIVQDEEPPVAPSPKIPTGPRSEKKWSRETLFNQKQNPSEAEAEAESDDDKATDPAMHHATAALYIRNFLRPVKLPDLERALISLASPPSAAVASNSTIVKTLHLDQVKTHALVLFSSISAASRVRSSLHGRIWPASETWRKELWVDFIPDEKVAEWIENEMENNEGRTGGRRWEVVYIENEEGVIEAIHREEGSNTSLAPRQPSGRGMPTPILTGPPPNAPSGPRSSTIQTRPSISQPTGPAPGTIPPSQAETFKTLDELFKFTINAKPKIYWQPVSDSLVEKRKDEFKHETSRDWTPAKWTDKDEEKRYTFEQGDHLVHSGPHNTSSRVRRREEGIRRGGVPAPRSVGGGGRGGGRKGGRPEWDSYRGGEREKESYRGPR